MPSWNAGLTGFTNANYTSLAIGESLYLFNAESPTPGATTGLSIAISRAYSPSAMDAGITFQISWQSAPTASSDSVVIQGSNDGVNWQSLYTSNGGLQQDNYTDTTRWNFYRAELAAESTGGEITVLAQR